MIGRFAPIARDVTIVGAGISGLVMAYVLDREGFQVTLLEASDRAGGLIRTDPTPFGPAESAAHSILASRSVRQFCEELGVTLESVRKDAKARYIWRAGRMRKFPLGIFEAIWAFLRAYVVLAPKAQLVTMEDWGRRFLGKTAVKYALGPFLRGIYGVKPSEVSVEAAFPGLIVPPGNSLISAMIIKRRKAGRRHLKRDREKKMAAPLGGMGELVSKLEERLTERLGDRFKKGHPVDQVPTGSNVILAVPAPEAGRLLEDLDPELSHALKSVAYVPMIAVTVFVVKNLVPRNPMGVGVLMPEGEGRESLGVLFNSSAFSNRVNDESKWSSYTMMLGGSSRPEVMEMSDEEITAIVKRELHALMGIETGIAHVAIRRQPHAIPRYDAHLLETWKLARAGWCARPGRILFGNYTGQVSVRGMIECAQEVLGGLSGSSET